MNIKKTESSCKTDHVVLFCTKKRAEDYILPPRLKCTRDDAMKEV